MSGEEFLAVLNEVSGAIEKDYPAQSVQLDELYDLYGATR